MVIGQRLRHSDFGDLQVMGQCCRDYTGWVNRSPHKHWICVSQADRREGEDFIFLTYSTSGGREKKAKVEKENMPRAQQRFQ